MSRTVFRRVRAPTVPLLHRTYSPDPDRSSTKSSKSGKDRRSDGKSGLLDGPCTPVERTRSSRSCPTVSKGPVHWSSSTSLDRYPVLPLLPTVPLDPGRNPESVVDPRGICRRRRRSPGVQELSSRPRVSRSTRVVSSSVRSPVRSLVNDSISRLPAPQDRFRRPAPSLVLVPWSIGAKVVDINVLVSRERTRTPNLRVPFSGKSRWKCLVNGIRPVK